jgi:hypothetical protein
VFGFYYSVLPFVPFVIKRGSNFYFFTRIVFSTGQVIFVPKWPNGEFVSLKLAAFCWTKSLPCQNIL